MATIFTKIIRREIPAHIVAEDDRYLAFLDINPLTEGHTLVIPKVEVDYIFDLDEETLTGLHVFSKKVAIAIRTATGCKRVAVAILGLEVAHAHIHLIPMNQMSDANFSNPKMKLSSTALASMADKIRNSLVA